MTAARRAAALLLTAAVAQVALVLFAVLPPAGMVAAIFVNGLALGMVWGLLVGYLEGRRCTDLLLAAMTCSYIVSSGMVKDLGEAALSAGVGEAWMPAVVGLAVLPVFAAAVLLLDRLPPPSAADVARRAPRSPMGARDRRQFVRRFLPGVVLLLVVFLFLTAYRDFRDKYGKELFRELGYTNVLGLFTWSELPVGLVVLAVLAAFNAVADHRRALAVVFGTMTAGTLLLGGATLLLDAGLLDGLQWMILTGLGAYLAYAPFGAVLFERVFAHTRCAGTAAFAIMVADAAGYSGTVAVLLFKEFGAADLSWLNFCRGFTFALAGGGTALLAGAAVYFLSRRLDVSRSDDSAVPASRAAGSPTG
jgi:hypothetical protein